MTRMDMGKATFGQSRNRDISHSKCSTRVCTFKATPMGVAKKRVSNAILQP